MPFSRGKTERPREPLLQLGIGCWDMVCRIGGRQRRAGVSQLGVAFEIPPSIYRDSNLGPCTGLGTVSGGRFDWGGRLLKGNGGVRRFPRADWKPVLECKGVRELDCEWDATSRYESRS